MGPAGPSSSIWQLACLAPEGAFSIHMNFELRKEPQFDLKNERFPNQLDVGIFERSPDSQGCRGNVGLSSRQSVAYLGSPLQRKALPAQAVDATLACSLLAGAWKPSRALAVSIQYQGYRDAPRLHRGQAVGSVALIAVPTNGLVAINSRTVDKPETGMESAKRTSGQSVFVCGSTSESPVIGQLGGPATSGQLGNYADS